MTAVTDTAPTGPASPTPVEPAVPGELAPENAADGGPAIDLADQIIRLVRTWTYLKAKMVASVDPEASSLFLVGRLVKDGPTRAKDLAEATCADQSTVSRQVAGLVKAGLIERQADPDDGRASILVPTPLGVEKMNQHFATRGEALEPLLADWSADERRDFLHLLRRFTSNLEARRDEVARVMTRSPLHHSHSALPEAPETHHVHPYASTERSN